MKFFNNIKTFIENLKGKGQIFLNNTQTKLYNLYQTNYDTGMYHINHGNILDATFRFKFITKLWPNDIDARYYFAYCLVLNEFYLDAKTQLNQILKLEPNNVRGQDLLNKINNGEVRQLVYDYKKLHNLLEEETAIDTNEDKEDNNKNRDNI